MGSNRFQNPLLRRMHDLSRMAESASDLIELSRLNQEMHQSFEIAIGGANAGLQKRVEAARLLLFALHDPPFPDGEILATESPDFLVSTEAGTIGIELREVFANRSSRSTPSSSGDFMRLQERLQDQIVDEACRIFTARGGQALRVSFCFADDTDFHRRDVSQIADQLAAIVRTVRTEVAMEPVVVDCRAAGVALPSYLSHIIVAPRPECVRDLPRWDASHGGTVVCANQAIQAAIDDKASKISEYRKRCDRVWLVLIVDGFGRSALLHEPSDADFFNSPFDRTVGFWLAYRRVVNFKCRER